MSSEKIIGVAWFCGEMLISQESRVSRDELLEAPRDSCANLRLISDETRCVQSESRGVVILVESVSADVSLFNCRLRSLLYRVEILAVGLNPRADRSEEIQVPKVYV